MPRTTDLDLKKLAELSPQAALRLEHAGQWVAWSEDFSRIIAAGGSREEVRAAAIVAGDELPLCEWIPLDLSKNLGDGE
jgi:hypothetical protein